MSWVEPLSAARIEKELSLAGAGVAGDWSGVVRVEPIVDSTNDCALEDLAAGLPNGSIVVAEAQRKGRGRNGRTWHSPRADNIYFSMLWRLGADDDVSGLSLASGVVIVRTMTDFGLSDLQLKWPNDVFWREYKLAGVLVELRHLSEGALGVVIGIGINGCLSEQDRALIDRPCTDLDTIYQSLGRADSMPSRSAVVATLARHLHDMLMDYADSGFDAWRQAWQELDICFGREVMIHTANKRVSGIAQGVDGTGAFRLDTASGLELFTGGSLDW